MREFDYQRAHDVSGALSLLAADLQARFLADGTNLVDLMKSGIERPARLVDVCELPLDRIEMSEDGGLRIGASVTNSDLTAHPEVRCRYPALTQAVLAGRPDSCATWPPWAATCSSAPVAATSPTWPTPATSASRAAAAPPWAGSITITPSWAPPSTAWRPTRRTWAWR